MIAYMFCKRNLSYPERAAPGSKRPQTPKRKRFHFGYIYILLTHSHMKNTVDGCEIQFTPLGNHGGSHCLLVFTGESTHSRDSERWCEMDFATIDGILHMAAGQKYVNVPKMESWQWKRGLKLGLPLVFNLHPDPYCLT